VGLALLSRDQLRRALDEADRTGRSLAATLVTLGYIEEEALVGFLTRGYRVPRVDLAQVSSDTHAAAAVPRDVCARLRVIPLRICGGVLVVAMDDPSDSAVLDELRSVAKLEPAPVVAAVSALAAALGG
jgi:type IV pilus assembly protein PilB